MDNNPWLVGLKGGESGLIKIDWDMDTQWDVRFREEEKYLPKAPFRDWLPVTDMDIDRYRIQDFTFSVGNVTELSVPLSRGMGSMSCTFLDSGGCMRNYFENWIKLIYPKFGVVACVGDPGVIRKLEVAELYGSRQIRSKDTYYVRIADGLSLSRGSEGNFQQYKVKFKIHGWEGLFKDG